MPSLQSRIGISCLYLFTAALVLSACSAKVTERAGEYLLSNAKQLKYFAEHYGDDLPLQGTYVLAKDIDMSKAGEYVPSRNNFIGHFDGKGHVISHLTIRLPDEEGIGFFRSIGDGSHQAVVENLALTDIHVLGKNTVGSLAGMLYGTVKNCFLDGEIHAMLHCAGGIVGRMPEIINQNVIPTMTDCYSDVAVICDGEADSQGGLAGRTMAPGSNISNCICTGEVIGHSKTGGLVGYMWTNTSLKSCLSLNKIIKASPGTKQTGEFVGQMDIGAENENNIGWDMPFRSKKTFEQRGWLFSQAWEWVGSNGNGYPRLRLFPGLEKKSYENWNNMPYMDVAGYPEDDRITVTIKNRKPGNQYCVTLLDRNLPAKCDWHDKDSFCFAGLSSGKVYRFAVRCRDANGNVSGWYRMTFNTSYTYVADKTPVDIACVVSEDPATCLNFSWTTLDTTVTSPAVWIAKATDSSALMEHPVSAVTHVMQVRNTVNKKLFDGICAFHSASVAGLEPATAYCYVVGDKDSGMISPMRYVTTASLDSDELSFAYVTDIQIGSEKAEKQIERMYENIVEKCGGMPDFIYNAGDMTENGYNYSQWHSYFKAGSAVLSQVFIVPAQGNHDTDQDMCNHFQVKSMVDDIPFVYSFDYGCVHFVVLNTQYWEQPYLTRQLAWAEKDIRQNRRRWNVLMLHRAIYAATDHVDDRDIDALRQNLSPFIERMSIDVVLMGHDHSFSRGFIRNGQNARCPFSSDGDRQIFNSPSAPLYIVNGTAGVAKWYHKIKYDPTKLHRVSENYDFIDKTSADYTTTKHEQSFSTVHFDYESMSIDTWSFKCTADGEYEIDPYLFDSITIKK